MNATIAAGHTGSHIRTFTEIARQIGNTSQRLSLRVQKMKEDTNLIVSTTLDAMIKSTHLDSFEKCRPHIKGLSNIRLLRERIKDLQLNLEHAIHNIFNNLMTISSDLKDIESTQKKIWAIITRLRIEASTMDESEQIFILSIADSLNSSLENASASIADLNDTIRSFKEKLSLQMKEDLRYAS